MAEDFVLAENEAGTPAGNGRRLKLVEPLLPVLRTAMFHASGSPGLEIGGLLAGPQGLEDRESITVTEAIPIALQNRDGASFALSALDLRGLAGVLFRLRHDPARTVVGFYRSDAQGEPALRESDFELLKTIELLQPTFATHFRIVMLLASKGSGRTAANLALRSKDGWAMAGNISLECAGTPLPASEIAAPLQPPAAPERRSVKPKHPGRKTRRPLWVWLAAAAVVGIGLHRAREHPQCNRVP